jgi:DDE family transposase
MERIVAAGTQVLIPPDSGKRKGNRPGWSGGLYGFMREVLSTELGSSLYRRRQQLVEPVFANTKHNRGINRFHRRGRAAVRTEWRLITAAHNLLKLHRHQLATA